MGDLLIVDFATRVSYYRRMWLELRGWWYAKGFGKSDKMPRDVREYIIRRYMKAAIAMQKTDQEREKLAGTMLQGVLGLGPDEISPELRDEVIKTVFENVKSEPDPLPLPKGPYPIDFRFFEEATERKAKCDRCGAVLLAVDVYSHREKCPPRK